MSSFFTYWLSGKRPYLIIMLGCTGLILGAIGIQHFVRLVPCPLCIAQRVFFGLVGLCALVGYYGPSTRIWERVVTSGILLLALLGGSIAGRQVWLQHFPPAGFDPTKCAVSFGSFLDSFLRALGGAGNCALRDFSLIGLQLSEWSLMCFIGLIGVSFWLIRRKLSEID